MKISKYLKADLCIMHMQAKTKEEAVKEISLKLAQEGKINDMDKFIRDILEREGLGSTGIGHGIAVPHARTGTVSDFVIGFGRSNEGIDFNAIDGDKVSLIFLMGANPKELNLYLRLLAELSKFLMKSSFRRELMEAESGDDVLAAIKRFEEEQ